MNKITTCISVENKKFLNSKVPLISLLALTLLPLAGGFFMIILKDPALAQKLGLISAKANIIGMGTADWPSYFSLLAQGISIGGLVVFGFNISWIFGREYSDRTIKDLLALPISRNIIVLSKFIVVALWCLILSMIVLVLGFIVGKAVDIPGWSWYVIRQGILVYILCSILTILLSTPVAFIASVGRGYLAPLGLMVFTIVLAQIFAITGYGEYFPWSVPALISGLDGTNLSIINGFSIIIVIMTGIIGLVGTMLWWRYANQN